MYQLRTPAQWKDDIATWQKQWDQNTIAPDLLLKDMKFRIHWWFASSTTPMTEATLVKMDVGDRTELVNRALYNLVQDGTVVRVPMKQPEEQQPLPIRQEQQPQPSPIRQEQQQPPIRQEQQQHPLYKTVLCRHYNTNDGCSWGDRCKYAHGKDDLRKLENDDEDDQAEQERRRKRYARLQEIRRANGACPFVQSNLHCTQGKHRCMYMHPN